MSLTGSHHAYASLHEDGMNALIGAFRAARPWYFSFATSMLGGGAPPSPTTLIPNPITIPGTALSFHYRINFVDLKIDFFPGGVPPELAPLNKEQFAIRAGVEITVLCPGEGQKDTRTYTEITAKLELWAVGSPTATSLGGGKWRLGLSLTGVEIVDITPKELENILECFLMAVLREAVIPELTFILDKLTTDFFSLALADGPHVDADRIMVFGNVS